MRHVVVFISLCVLLLPALVTAQRAGGADATPQMRGGKGQALVLPPEVHLTDEQTTKINTLTTAMQTELDAWDKAHNDEMNKMLTDARATKDRNEAQRLYGQMMTLRDTRTEIETKYHRQMMDVLTPDQQATYWGWQAYRQGEYAQIAKALQLTPEQDAKMKEQAKVYGAAKAKWDKENGDKAAQLEQQLREAQMALMALRAVEDKLTADNHAAIMAILTPEQQTALEVNRLQQEVMMRFRVKLTDDQQAKVKTLCEAAAADIAKLSAGNEKDRRPVVEKLAQTISDQVLTAEQKASLMPKQPAR